MRYTKRMIPAVLAAAVLAAPAYAQEKAGEQPAPAEATADKASSPAPLVKPIPIQHLRPADKRGLNMFEAPKTDDVPFTGFKLDLGAGFAQQFQALEHSNTAAPKQVSGANVNKLVDLGAGFNLATANLYLNGQLAPGIRVALEGYMSSRGHSEFWVKGGYLQIDESPIKLAVLENVMKYATLKVGHFEINYGDAHFRRTDNGNALQNAFVGNYILDSFTTEIGAELYLRKGSLFAMGGVTNAEIKGAVADPENRGFAFLGKVGVDKQLGDALRFRLTGSAYTSDRSTSNTLFSGDRAGARYYEVLVNRVGENRWSGNLQPGFKNQVSAVQVNPFIKLGGLELFGVVEKARGKAATEAEERTIQQYAGDVVYRFFQDEKLYVGGRYNTVKAELAGVQNEVSVGRWQVGGGWFVTPTVLLKAEYVTQKYNDFPTADIRNGGKFNGLMFEGAVAF